MLAQVPAQPPGLLDGPGTQQSEAHFLGVSPRLRDLPPEIPTGPHHIIPFRATSKPRGGGGGGGSTTDPVLQAPSGSTVAFQWGGQSQSWWNFLGLGQGFPGFTVQAAPPDVNGAVGPTQYVQWVNLSIAVFDKATGTLQAGPVAGNLLWPSNEACGQTNDGDPIAQYDKLANRWILTQFSVSLGAGNYYQCIAVSVTPDATGSYYSYQLPMPAQSYFPDYPKLGVWPDGYYMSWNLFFGGLFFSGAQVAVLERSAMLAGATARAWFYNTGSSYASLLPGDLDGTLLPPSTSGTSYSPPPNYFVSLGSSSSLNLWRVQVTNWSTGINVSGPTSLAVPSYAKACNGGTCIPQAGTSQKLDSLGDRLMYRLAYRNLGNHQSLVVSHSVNATSSQTGVRWYEWWVSGTAPLPSGCASYPCLAQRATYYVPDAQYRWMPSLAMDKLGNIAMGYSVSGGSSNPAIHFTGHIAGVDGAGIMESEAAIINGTGSQSGNNLSRWGDYNSMAVDPLDDCTLWYANEYIISTGSFNWSTRVAAFSLLPPSGSSVAACKNVGDFYLSLPYSINPDQNSATQTVPSTGGSASYTINVNRLVGYPGSVSFAVANQLPAGISATINSTTNSATVNVTVQSGTAAGNYVLTVVATGAGGSPVRSTQLLLVVQ